jgi:hypothetical protein
MSPLSWAILAAAVDKAEFLILELLRLEATDVDTILRIGER